MKSLENIWTKIKRLKFNYQLVKRYKIKRKNEILLKSRKFLYLKARI